MTQEVRHTLKYNDVSSTDQLLLGEIVYTDSNTIKIGDGEHIFSQLPEFSSSQAMGDNKTIGANSNNKIQALGTVNKNPDAIVTSEINHKLVFDWIGTTQEYVNQNVATNHPDWLCFITDDNMAGSATGTYTRAEIDAFLTNKADGTGTAVLTSGDQNIEGNKIFLNSGLKSKSGTIDYTATPAETEYLSLVMAHDKNGQRIGNVELFHATDGAIGVGINASVKVNGSNVYSPNILTWVSQDGQTKWTETSTPANATDNSGKIATTAHVINVLKAMYPVGAIFLGTTATCPMAQFFGTWELVSSGKALWTGNGTLGSGTTANANYANASANTTITAGAPNISGSFQANVTGAYSASGAFSGSGTWNCGHGWNGEGSGGTYSFNASSSNSIYGTSSTIQPPAYVVNVWRRTT